MSRRVQKQLAKYKRRKDTARTSGQFMKWSIRFHALRNRKYGPPNLWSTDAMMKARKPNKGAA